jgi:hypothetical protein
MNQNSWITPGIITSCKHKIEQYKELKNNNNKGTLASYYRDYAEILSRVIREAKITENDQLILNSHNKVKTTWSIINKESGKNKKRGEIQALKVEGKEIMDNKQLQKLLMSTLLLLQKMLKDRVKIILLMMITILW